MNVEPAIRRRLRREILLRALPPAATALAVLPLLFVLFYVIVRGAAVISPAFLSRLPGPVAEPGGGVGNGIVGSFLLVGLACLLAVPAGLLAGMYLSEFGRGPFGRLIRFAAEVLGGVPSIVVGLFVYSLLVRPMGGFSTLAGGVALAILMLPTVTRTAEEMLRLVPDSLREAGYALGIQPWKVILRLVLPAARTGLLTGVLLGVARIAGETAPLLFTSFNNNFWSTSLTHPIAALPVQVFTFALTPFAATQEKAWGAALLLILFVLGLNIAARLVLAARKGAS